MKKFFFLFGMLSLMTGCGEKPVCDGNWQAMWLKDFKEINNIEYVHVLQVTQGGGYPPTVSYYCDKN